MDQVRVRKRKPGGGRPTVLTPELQDKICGYLEVGAHLTVACAACGIAKKTYYLWLEQIEADRSRTGDPLPQYLQDFAVKVASAKAKFEVANLELIKDMSLRKREGNFFAAAWLLERTQPDKYSLVFRTKQTLDQTITVKDALDAAEKLT